MIYKIVGLRVENILGQDVSGHNLDFEYTDVINYRYVFLLVDDCNRKSELALWQSEGECGSGWCTASFDHFNWEYVANFLGKTHNIKDGFPKTFNTLYTVEDGVGSFEIKNVVTYSESDCIYYPNGLVSVNMDAFEKVCDNRGFDKIPCHILIGESNTGKSYFGSIIENSNHTRFETDANDELPDYIKADVIVVGNKHGLDESDILSRIDTDLYEPIIVRFSRP